MEYLKKQTVKWLQRKGFSSVTDVKTTFEYLEKLIESWGWASYKKGYKKGYKEGYKEALNVDKTEL